MEPSWIAQHPDWYASELALLARYYPDFRIDPEYLEVGALVVYVEVVVRRPGGAHRQPLRVVYPEATPYEQPAVVPLKSAPRWAADDSLVGAAPEPEFFSARHQMPGGNLCLFERETRAAGGDLVDIRQVLRRAEQWLRAHATGRFPPDTVESELESHFRPGGDILVEEAFDSPDLGPHGLFFMVPDLFRVHEKKSGAYSAIVIGGTSEGNGVARAFDFRKQLARLYP